jgi:hypothetical protein
LPGIESIAVIDVARITVEDLEGELAARGKIYGCRFLIGITTILHFHTFFILSAYYLLAAHVC